MAATTAKTLVAVARRVAEGQPREGCRGGGDIHILRVSTPT